MFACWVCCHLPILAGEKLRWPIPVPLTVISAWRNQGGQWWEFAIVGGGTHVGGIFWGYFRKIYCITYVGIVFRSLIFETSINQKSKKLWISTSMSACHLLFHHEDSVCDPQTLVPSESWDSQLSPCVICVGGRTDYLRLCNLKHRVLAGTKNSSWTDRCQKSGRFEIKRFLVLSTLISIKHAILSDW
jgi:hypothetical protein